MQTTRLAMAFLLAAILSACGEQAADDGGAADLLLVNGRVYTLNWGDPAGDGALAPDAPRDERGWKPDASAVAVKGGKIVFVGDTRDVREYRSESTRVVDLAGATVILDWSIPTPTSLHSELCSTRWI